VLGSSWVAAAERPNIVLILADDLGFSDTAPYGGEIATPNIARLANEGVRFSNYHTASSCAPTRAMLLTGVDSHLAGVPNIPEAIPPAQRHQPNYQGTLNRDVVTIATRLQDAGYHTYLTGKWHLGHGPGQLPFYRGFERTVTMALTGSDNWQQKSYLPIYDDPHWYADGEPLTLPQDYYSSEYLVDRAIGFIESNRADGQPFFWISIVISSQRRAARVPRGKPRTAAAAFTISPASLRWSRMRNGSWATSTATSRSATASRFT
jgi:arylsulfatase/uncharacterized sulfatase